MDTKKAARQTGIWVVTVLLILWFARAGIQKFPGNGFWSNLFRKAGYPVWFRYAVGVWETAAAALLIYPRTAGYGAAGVVAVMLGAIGTDVMHGWWKGLVGPTVAIVFAGIVLAARWSRRLTLPPVRPLVPQR